MNLILDSSGSFAHWILSKHAQTVDSVLSTEKFDASAQVIPLLQQLFKKNKCSLKDITHLAYCSGPGSFTGLRISAAHIKALAFNKDKKIIALDNMNLIQTQFLEQYPNFSGTLCAIIASRKNHVYLNCIQYKGQKIQSVYPTQEYSLEKIQSLDALNQNCTFIGADAILLQDMFNTNIVAETLKPKTFTQACHHSIQNQSFVALESFEPNYIVQSVAKPKNSG